MQTYQMHWATFHFVSLQHESQVDAIPICPDIVLPYVKSVFYEVFNGFESAA